MRDIAPHPEQEHSYAKLRDQFRAEHLADLRSQMSKHPLGWGVLGEPALARVYYSADEWAHEMLARLDAPVSQDFGLSRVPNRESAKLEDLAQKAMLHEQVTWEDGTEGTFDHDAPPCKQISEMTDEEIFAYVDLAIEESKNGAI